MEEERVGIEETRRRGETEMGRGELVRTSVVIIIAPPLTASITVRL